ncbi:Antitoxin RelF [Marinomonas aquimarina]|uniref:Antitoxin n=1 Tax=Marinomonas aquimarina TaxID=295068 RepID=A0A1A8T8Q7_9GAMM|nr:type II toxin-antitoxin system Phd/YefM family antitoxin [Marinomonas aquimarina]SBS29067.1 Antitoxin RelF [Marinomonas aquimarina]
MRTMTVKEAQNSLPELIDQLNQDNEIIEIQHEADNVVMMSSRHYESLQESLYLLSQPGFKSDFERSVKEANAGITNSFEDVFGKS